jgi:hypothetical protein
MRETLLVILGPGVTLKILVQNVLIVIMAVALKRLLRIGLVIAEMSVKSRLAVVFRILVKDV